MPGGRKPSLLRSWIAITFNAEVTGKWVVRQDKSLPKKREDLVRIAGLEPARVAPLPPQSSVSANSTICAHEAFLNQAGTERTRKKFRSQVRASASLVTCLQNSKHQTPSSSETPNSKLQKILLQRPSLSHYLHSSRFTHHASVPIQLINIPCHPVWCNRCRAQIRQIGSDGGARDRRNGVNHRQLFRQDRLHFIKGALPPGEIQGVPLFIHQLVNPRFPGCRR